MFILPVIVIVSIVFYIYYKVAILKTKEVIMQLYYNGRARMALGTFILTSGITLYVFYQSKLSIFIALIFTLLGALQFIRGFNESRHYQKEYRKIHSK